VKRNLPLIILGATIILFFVVSLMRPEPVDWSMSFSKRDTIPFGCYILYSLLPDLFPRQQVQPIYDSAYDLFKDRKFDRVNYIIIDNTIALDKFDTEALFKFISEGNNVFLAASYYQDDLAKKLEIRTLPGNLSGETTTVNFTNPRLAVRRGYVLGKGTGNMRFTAFRRKGSTVLGVNGERGVNLIRIRYGKGALYLSSIPYAYTNYDMLEDNNAEYVFKSLSYLPVRRTFWDEHYKAALAAPTSPLRYVLSRAPLTWAYYTGLAGLLLFAAFKARRRQRVVPVLERPANATLDFVATIGRLYYERSDHKNIADKMILYFYEYLNSRFHVDAQHREENFYERTSGKTGVPVDCVRRIFEASDEAAKSKKISERGLIRLSALIEEFKSYLER
jgi:hypothetical protein